LEQLKTEQEMRERMKQLQQKHGVSEKQVCAHYRIVN
jgi:membrane protein insertase Oxa1/YidC/SpoIIIJ